MTQCFVKIQNIFSLDLKQCCYQVQTPQDILNASRLIFPGVGAFASAMEVLSKTGYFFLYFVRYFKIFIFEDACSQSFLLGFKVLLNENTGQGIIFKLCNSNTSVDLHSLLSD